MSQRSRRTAAGAHGDVAVRGGVRADRGGVAAGRDVVGDLVVTGDGNTFFCGGYQRLQDAYIEASEIFDWVEIENFAGREWLITALDRFLEENKCGYFVIQAPAGLGKTAFLAHLVRTRGWVHHFCELAPGEAGIVPARLNLAAQLIRAFELQGEATVSEAPAARPDFLRGLLRQAAEHRRDGEKLVIAVDAIDEAAARPGENVLGLPRLLPPGVFVVVTKRPVHVALWSDSPCELAEISAESDENRHDVRAFLVQAARRPELLPVLQRGNVSAEFFRETLLAKSGGVWIYLRYALQQIASDPDHRLDLEGLPQGLWGWYYRFWRSWKENHADTWHRAHLRVLATLAVAQEDLTVEQLCQLAGVQPALAELPPAWRPYLTVRREQPPRYRLYHASLGDFLHGATTTQDLAEQDFAEELRQACSAAHSTIADRYLTAWGGLEAHLPGLRGLEPFDVDTRYGLDHLVDHLRHAQRYEELFKLVDEATWRIAHLIRDPSAGALLDDVAHAWDTTATIDLVALEEGRRPPFLMREVAYAFATAELHSLAGHLPGELVVRLLATNAWSARQAIATAMRREDPQDRARVLAMLTPHLPTQQRAQILAGAFDAARIGADAEIAGWSIGLRTYPWFWTPSEFRLDLFREIIASLPTHLLPDALTAARSLDSASTRAAVLLALAPYLSEDLVLDVLSEANSLAEQFGRASGDAVDEQTGELLGLAAAHIDQILAILTERDTAIAARAVALAPEVSDIDRERLLRVALNAASSIGDVRAASASLAALAPDLPDDLMAEALLASTEIGVRAHRAAAVAALAPHLSDALLADAVRATLEDAGEIWARSVQAAVQATLAALAPRLPEHVFVEVLNAAKTNRDNLSRQAQLAALAPHLPDHLLSDVLADAEFPRPDASPGDVLTQTALVAALAARLPGKKRDLMLARALADAPKFNNPRAVAAAFEALASHLPRTMLADALIAATAIGDPAARAAAFSAIAPQLPDDLLDEGLAAATSPTPAERTSAVGARAAAFAALAEHLTDDERGRLLSDVMTIVDPADRASALSSLVPHLPDEQRASVLAGALSAAGEIDTTVEDMWAEMDDVNADTSGERSRARAAVLGTLAPYLPDALLAEAFTSAKTIDDPSARAAALGLLAPYLPENLLPDALIVVTTVNSGFDRAFALIAMAPRLSPHLREAAFKAADAIDDPGYRSIALRIFAPLVAEEMVTEIFTSGDASRRMHAFLALAPGSRDDRPAKTLDATDALGDDPLGGATEAALASLFRGDGVARALDAKNALHDYALSEAALAPLFRDDRLADTLDAAESIDDPVSRVIAVSSLLPRLAEDERDGAVAGAVQTISSIDPYARLFAVGALAPHLDAGERTRVVSGALEAGLTLDNPIERAQAVRVLGPYLQDEERARAVTVASTIDEPVIRYVALLLMELYLTDQLRSDALNFVETAGYSFVFDLCAYARYLPADFLARALTATTTIHPASSRAGLLSDLVPYVPRHLLALALALDATSTIDDLVARTGALSALASREKGIAAVNLYPHFHTILRDAATAGDAWLVRRVVRRSQALIRLLHEPPLP